MTTNNTTPKAPAAPALTEPSWQVVSRPGAVVRMEVREFSAAERAALTIPVPVRLPPALPSKKAR